MKTSTFAQFSNAIRSASWRAPFAAFLSRSCVALLIVLSLLWSLVGPVRAEYAKPAKPKSGTTRIPTIPQTTETFTVYGPHRFDRHTGAPVNVVDNFSIPADAIAPFTIGIQNGGTDGSGRVSSATIRLNGSDVFTPKDFNQTVGSLTKTVSLVA